MSEKLSTYDVHMLVLEMERYRAMQQYTTADAIRTRLAGLGVQVRNGSTTWTVHGPRHGVRDWKGWVF